jgi:quercetin dioxygenase-like cupin family protein
MKTGKIKDTIRGWFVGDFDKAIFRTKDCEVMVREYKAGDYEDKHLHKLATEITLIVRGKVLMNGKEYSEGDMIVMEPGEATDFKALTDTTNCVVKVPSVMGDKYPAE